VVAVAGGVTGSGVITSRTMVAMASPLVRAEDAVCVVDEPRKT
jgi:hypothetical protein